MDDSLFNHDQTSNQVASAGINAHKNAAFAQNRLDQKRPNNMLTITTDNDTTDNDQRKRAYVDTDNTNIRKLS